jgi:hypothetical protein
MKRHAALGKWNGTTSLEGSGNEEWLGRTKSNNSFDRSGISLDVIRQIECFSQFFPLGQFGR